MRAHRLLLLLSLTTALAANAAEFFVAQGGSDSASGALQAPWRTLRFAVAQLRPGDTLWVGDGTWTPASGGLLAIDCGAAQAQSGTSAQPITVRAVNERRAVLASDGQTPAVQLTNCSWWVIEGLTATMGDRMGGTGEGTVTVAGARDVVLRRLLVRGNNRFTSSHAVKFQGSRGLLEELEVYDFSAVGIVVDGATLRRSYLNSRARADEPLGRRSVDPTRGDEAIQVINGNQVIENNISEGQQTGISQYTYGSGPNDSNLFQGNIVFGGSLGFHSWAGAGQSRPQHDTRWENSVALGNVGFALYSAVGATITRATVVGGNAGVVSTANALSADAGQSTFVHASVFLSVDAGLMLEPQTDWRIDSNAFFDSPTRVVPASLAAREAGSLQLDPRLGSCLVYLPDGSPLRNALSDGGDVGASVVTRSIGGVVTAEPLWDPQTGAFTCGAVIAGINDVAGASCRDVHLRLRVGTPGCPLPRQAVDGGVDGGVEDGGVDRSARALTVGCDCASAPGLWAVLALALLRTRRR